MGLDFTNWDKGIEVLVVAIYEGPAKWQWRRELSDEFNLWMAVEGEGTFAIDGKTWPFSPGSIFLFPPRSQPEGYSSGRIRMANFTAHIKAGGKSAKLLRALAGDSGPVHFRNFIWAAHLCRYLSEIFYLKPAQGRELIFSGLRILLQSMDYERALPPVDPSGEALIRLIERIRRNPAASYSVPEMASSARLSTAQFTRRFKAITGLTPNRFTIEERLGRAELYLRESDLSVQEIANRLGYNDVYFFSRQFQRFRGMSPICVRRKLKGAQQ